MGQKTNKRQMLQKLKTTQKKVNSTKYSRTKLPWFSRLIWHSARKQGGLILQRFHRHYC